MHMNKPNTARLYIDGEYVADVSLGKSHLFKEAMDQYKEDENLGRLLWKLDGVKVEVLRRAELKQVYVCCSGYIHHGKTLSELASVNFKFDNCVADYYLRDREGNHFLKYSGNRKGKKGRKFPIIKKNF